VRKYYTLKTYQHDSYMMESIKILSKKFFSFAYSSSACYFQIPLFSDY